ncbi:unnamed protein product [Protopolystoma xenopodis]|uniref:Uncharacterized protein n=1 Tax=Protopolystoma xenopodis TaxID=117903 RepID=A0A3S5AIV7_9PLAT|nr:unnamed protein product [Protopolystoma xenopodis]
MNSSVASISVHSASTISTRGGIMAGICQSSAILGHDLSGKRRRAGKQRSLCQKSDLEESYPDYLMEAFYGDDLLFAAKKNSHKHRMKKRLQLQLQEHLHQQPQLLRQHPHFVGQPGYNENQRAHNQQKQQQQYSVNLPQQQHQQQRLLSPNAQFDTRHTNGISTPAKSSSTQEITSRAAQNRTALISSVSPSLSSTSSSSSPCSSCSSPSSPSSITKPGHLFDEANFSQFALGKQNRPQNQLVINQPENYQVSQQYQQKRQQHNQPQRNQQQQHQIGIASGSLDAPRDWRVSEAVSDQSQRHLMVCQLVVNIIFI